MSNNQKPGFHLKVTHTEPVTPGTVVRLELVDGGSPGPEWVKDYEFTWTVVGPFSGDRRTFPAGPLHDFDTSGFRPGAYTFSVLRKRRETSTGTGEIEAETEVRKERRAESFLPSDPSSRAVAAPDGSAGDGGRAPDDGDGDIAGPWIVYVTGAASVNEDGVVPVSLQRTGVSETPDQALWTLIRNRTNAIGFRSYKTFIDGVMCRGTDIRNPKGSDLTFTGSQAYEVLKQATNAFLMQESGVIDKEMHPRKSLDLQQGLDGFDPVLHPSTAEGLLREEARRMNRRSLDFDTLRRMRDDYLEDLGNEQNIVLPYLRIIRDRLSDVPLKQPAEIVDANCYGVLRSRVTAPPALELIWSYWMEEGLLVQTLNAILARFQNRRLSYGRDPLARLDLDPLRPLANLFWGWAEDEMHRLTVRRRAYEYDHEYGLMLIGRAVPTPRTVDSRSRFLESFHHLLNLAHLFFKEDDDTTVIADGFPMLNALRETHLILSQGAHNQFGDLPSTARAEMLIMQWLLGRPEMREFLGGRVMVPYEEEWQDRVDTMKSLQGWSDVTVTHFRDLGVYGEQLLLGIRYGNWSIINDPQQAANWARYWRPELQRYVHAYRAATGVDLTASVDSRLPGHLLRARLAGASRHN